MEWVPSLPDEKGFNINIMISNQPLKMDSRHFQVIPSQYGTKQSSLMGEGKLTARSKGGKDATKKGRSFLRQSSASSTHDNEGEPQMHIQAMRRKSEKNLKKDIQVQASPLASIKVERRDQEEQVLNEPAIKEESTFYKSKTHFESLQDTKNIVTPELSEQQHQLLQVVTRKRQQANATCQNVAANKRVSSNLFPKLEENLQLSIQGFSPDTRLLT